MSSLCRGRKDEKGVSEIVGTILTMGITMVLFTSVYAAVNNLESPERRDHIEMVGEYERVEDYDYINITHKSGNSLDLEHLVFNLLGEGARQERFRFGEDDGNLSISDDDGEWSVGEKVTIQGEIFDEGDADIELLIQNTDTNRVVYQTALVEEIPGRLSIRRTYIRYKHEWRNYAEQGEEVEIIAELSNIGEDENLEVFVPVSEDNLWVEVDEEGNQNDIRKGEKISLEKETGNKFSNENLQIKSNATEDHYNIRIEAEVDGEEVWGWVRLNVGRKVAERYPKELEIGRVIFNPSSISHGSELEVIFEVYNHGDENATADWSIFDDFRERKEEVREEGVIIEHGPSPTQLSGSFEIEGSGRHNIDIVVEGHDDWEGAERSEEINVDPHLLIVEDESASDTYEAELMMNSLDGLNLDYDYKELASENLYDGELGEHSMVIWMTGEKDEGDLSMLDHVSKLESYIEDERAVWVTGQRFGNENLSGMLGHDGDGFEESTNMNPSLDSENENGAFGEFVFDLCSTYYDIYNMGLHSGKGAYNDTLEDGEGDFYGAAYEVDDNQRTVANPFLFRQVRDPGVRMGLVAEVVQWATGIDARSGVDVAVTSQEIDPGAPMYLDDINVTVTFQNNGNRKIHNLENSARLVRNDGEDVLEPNIGDNESISLEENGGTATVNFTWKATELGVQELVVHADYYGHIDQTNMRNNDIRYKNLEITDDQVYVNVHYSTLVVNAGDDESVEKLRSSFDDLGHERGEDFAIAEYDMSDGIEDEDILEFNAVIWATDSGGIDQGEVDEIRDYLDDSGGNLMLIGENILDDLSGRVDGDDLLQQLGIDVETDYDEASSNKAIGQRENDFGRALRYKISATSIDAFNSTSRHGEVLLKDEDGNNIASTYDDGESRKTAYIGFGLDKIEAPLIDEIAFADSPLEDVTDCEDDAVTEFAYTSLWHFGKRDESLEAGLDGEVRRRTELRVTDYDIEPSSYQPHTGRSYQIRVTVENIGYRGASALVRVHEGDDHVGSESTFIEGSTREPVGDDGYFNVQPGRATIEVSWRPTNPGMRPLIVRIDSDREVPEIVEDNENGTGEGTENKIMEFNNAAKIEQPVYFFHDNMEDGEDNWRHDETLVNIDGTGPLDFADRQDMETDVIGNWSESYRDGAYETDDDEHGIEDFTDGAHYSNPRSYWMPETPPESYDDVPDRYEAEIDPLEHRYLITPSVDVEDTTAETLSFRTKYWMSQDVSGGMVYLWGNDGGDWNWQTQDRRYVNPQQSYPGDLNMEGLDGPSITGDNGGLECGEIGLPVAVFNGRSARDTFGWRYISADLSQHDDFIRNNDEIRVVFLTTQLLNEEAHDWHPEKGWYIDNVQLRVTRELEGDISTHDNGYWMRTSESEVIEKFDNLDDGHTHIQEGYYEDNTPGEGGDGHYWMFAKEDDGEPALPTGVDSSLYTSRIDLSNAENPTLSAHLKFNLDNREGTPPPGFRIDISDDGGRSWDELTYGVRGGWGVSGDEEHDGYSGTSFDDSYGWVNSHTLDRVDADLSGWRDETVILRFRVFTNNTDAYEDTNYPKPIFIDDVVVREDDMEDEHQFHTLTIDSTPGGEVISPGEGTFVFEPGTEVEVEAGDGDFIEWIGDYESEDEVITIMMDDDKEITARFDFEYDHTLTIEEIVGEGTVEIDGVQTTEMGYMDGEEATVEAFPDEDWIFDEWTGDYQGTSSEITIVMDEDKDITAYFEEDDEVETSIYHDGSGGVSSGDGDVLYYSAENVNVDGLDHIHLAYSYEVGPENEDEVRVEVNGVEVHRDASEGENEWSGSYDVSEDVVVDVEFWMHGRDHPVHDGSAEIYWAEHEYVDDGNGAGTISGLNNLKTQEGLEVRENFDTNSEKSMSIFNGRTLQKTNFDLSVDVADEVFISKASFSSKVR